MLKGFLYFVAGLISVGIAFALLVVTGLRYYILWLVDVLTGKSNNAGAVIGVLACIFAGIFLIHLILSVIQKRSEKRKQEMNDEPQETNRLHWGISFVWLIPATFMCLLSVYYYKVMDDHSVSGDRIIEKEAHVYSIYSKWGRYIGKMEEDTTSTVNPYENYTDSPSIEYDSIYY